MKPTLSDFIMGFLCLLIYLPFLVLAMGVVIVAHIVATFRPNADVSDPATKTPR